MAKLMLAAVLSLGLAVLVYAPGDTAPGVRDRVIASLHKRGVEVTSRALPSARAARRAGWRTASELAFFAEAARIMDTARLAREQVELEQALALYDQASHLYDAPLAACVPGVRELVADLELERGTVLVELGRATEARVAFGRALDLAHDLTLTETHARPDVVRLFREVAQAPRGADLACKAEDAVADRLRALETTPSADGLAALLTALPLDAIIVVAVSTDGERALVTRVTAAGATDPAPLALGDLDASLGALLERAATTPLHAESFSLSLDDPRLRAPAATLVSAPVARPKKRRVWPWIVAGAAVVGATVIGVTIGFVAGDARYSVKVSGGSFAP